MGINNYRLERMKSTECAAVLTNQTSSIVAATCTGAVLVNESLVQLKDPLYEAALNITELVESGLIEPPFTGDRSFSDYMLMLFMELILLFLLLKKVIASMGLTSLGLKTQHWDLVYCGEALKLHMISQVFANLQFMMVAWSSGASLFDTILATFALLIIADLDDKLLALFPFKRTSKVAESQDKERNELPLRSGPVKTRSRLLAQAQQNPTVEVIGRRVTFIKTMIRARAPQNIKEIAIFNALMTLISFGLAYALMVVVTAATCALNGLRFSYYTMSALAFGSHF